MARRSLSLPGRPSRITVLERKMSLPLSQRRKQVHWSNDLVEVFYFAPDSSVRDTGCRSADRLVKKLPARNGPLNKSKKQLPLKVALARRINGSTSLLLRTGVAVFSQQFDAIANATGNKPVVHQQQNSTGCNDTRGCHQQRMREKLEQQEEEWVWIVPGKSSRTTREFQP